MSKEEFAEQLLLLIREAECKDDLIEILGEGLVLVEGNEIDV